MTRPNNFICPALAVAALFLQSGPLQGDVLYVWSADGTIQKFDEGGAGSLLTTNNLSGGNGPVGLICDNVGKLYAGAPNDSQIWKFSPNGTSSIFGTVDSISGLSFDANGSLYATIPNFAEILKLEYGALTGYRFGLSTNYSQSNLSYPISMAFDRAGNIYVANAVSGFQPAYTNTIEKFSTNFIDLGAFATNLNSPWGLAFDKQYNLYVANSGTNAIFKNTILKFTTNGIRSSFANAANGLNSPRGIAFDSAGNLYVANSGNGTIQKIATNGNGTVFASGLNTPSSIAIFPGLNVWSATPISLPAPVVLANGAVQFTFTENPGLSFTALEATNLQLPLIGWTVAGAVTEVSAGQYQFADTNAANSPQRFYRVRAN